MKDFGPCPSAPLSWVSLHTVKTFPKEVFYRYQSEGRRQYALAKKCRDRLVKLVSSCKTTHKQEKTAIAATLAKKMACNASTSSQDGPATGTRSKLNTTMSAEKMRMHATTAINLSTSAAKAPPNVAAEPAQQEKELDIKEFRASLSSLKQAVVALGTLCHRLEANAVSSTQPAGPSYLSAREMSGNPPKEEKIIGRGGDHAPVEIQDAETQCPSQEGSDTSSGIHSSKRPRVSDWLRNVCRRRSPASLSSS